MSVREGGFPRVEPSVVLVFAAGNPETCKSVKPRTWNFTPQTRFPNEASMPRYFFNLYDGRNIIPDQEGTDLPDDDAARTHAFRVMRELARNREERTRAWRLVVCEEDQTTCFELAFAPLDDTRYRYPPRCA
jgi:hypothetical protein